MAEGSSTKPASSGNKAAGNSDTATTAAAATGTGTGTGTDAAAQSQKALEEDDEFEDFPVEDWGPEDTDVQTTAAAAARGNPNLWEESWDDDDVNEDFAAQLKQELKKIEAGKQ